MAGTVGVFENAVGYDEQILVDFNIKYNVNLIESIDVYENRILAINEKLLATLLKDRTTNKNIIWGTTNYVKYGKKFGHDNEIRISQITGRYGEIIKPRTAKGQILQKKRVRDRAEVFTPSWVCNAQNNLVDDIWLGKSNCFNTAHGNTWQPNMEPILFAQSGKSWKDYVLDKRLEISCGEAPYLVSRYDTVTGEVIPIERRIGILDRKLRVINENASLSEWVDWAQKAFQSTYGYEWQGDNLLIARENLLYTFCDYYFCNFHEQPSLELQLIIADIISWNIWQMDGLKCVVPNSCHNYSIIRNSLFGEIRTEEICIGCKTNNMQKHNGAYCKVKDWQAVARHDKSIFRFVDLFGHTGGLK